MPSSVTSILNIISNGLSVIAFILILISLKNSSLPIINSEKVWFYILWIIGFAMSVTRGMSDFPDGKFVMPKLILTALMILGALAFVLLIMMVFGLKKPVAFDYRTALMLLSVIIISKWILTRGYLLYTHFIK